MILDELERALRTEWSAGVLGVYGDHLQRLGDPRGELIALDLAPRPTDDEWRARRRELLVAWLGAELADIYGRIVQHGFLHAVRAGEHPGYRLPEPLAAVMRSYRVWAHTPERLADQLADLAREPRPWLARLVIHYEGAAVGSADAMIEATPNLAELYLLGDRPFAWIGHPTANVIELPRVIERYSNFDDAHLREMLAAIDATPDCNALYDHPALVAELVTPAEMIVRLTSSKLVVPDGPIVRLSSLGRTVLGWLTARPPITRRPASTIARDAMFGVSHPARPGDQDAPGQGVGLVHQHVDLVGGCVDRMPLEDRAELEHYLAFLARIVAAREQRVDYDGDVAVLARACRGALRLHELGDRGVVTFDDIGPYLHWRGFSGFVRLLEHVAEESVGVVVCVGYGGVGPRL